MKKILTLFGLVLLCATPAAFADLDYFGFTGDVDHVTYSGGGTDFTSFIDTIEDAWSVDVNSGFWFVGDDYIPARNELGRIDDDYASYGNRYILDLSRLIFREINDGQQYQCQWYTKDGSTYVTAGQGGAVWRLRADWQARVDDFMNHTTLGYPDNASILASGNALMLSVHLEANNGCVPPWVPDTVISYIRDNHLGNTVPLGVGYATTSYWARATKKLPAAGFPVEADRILTWNYGIFNPSDINDPRNLPPGFAYGTDMTPHFNQYAPGDIYSVWGNVVAKLRGRNDPSMGPTVIYGFEGGTGDQYSPSFVPQASHIVLSEDTGTGADEADMSELTTNWCQWLDGRPEILGGIVAGFDSTVQYMSDDPLDPFPYSYSNAPAGSLRRALDDCF